MDNGVERIENSEELAQIRRQARKVMIKSALFAAGLTLLVTLIPPLGG